MLRLPKEVAADVHWSRTHFFFPLLQTPLLVDKLRTTFFSFFFQNQWARVALSYKMRPTLRLHFSVVGLLNLNESSFLFWSFFLLLTSWGQQSLSSLGYFPRLDDVKFQVNQCWLICFVFPIRVCYDVTLLISASFHLLK